MSALIEQLTREHRELSELLGRIRTMDILSRAGQEALIAAEAGFIDHLREEDDEFYPAFKLLAGKDQALYDRLWESYRDLADVSLAVGAFFSKYIGADGVGDFLTDFDAVAALLKDRITREETLFFPEFNRLNSE